MLFLCRDKPVSMHIKPACIMKTKIAQSITHKVSILLVSTSITSWDIIKKCYLWMLVGANIQSIACTVSNNIFILFELKNIGNERYKLYYFFQLIILITLGFVDSTCVICCYFTVTKPLGHSCISSHVLSISTIYKTTRFNIYVISFSK